MSVPSKPSNRHLFDTMIAWGWVPGKPSNGHVEMIWDFPGTPKTKLTVAQSGHHAATADEVIKMVIQLTTGGDREKFWSRVTAAQADAIPDNKALVTLTPVSAEAKRRRGAAAKALSILIDNGGAMGVNVIQKEMPDFSRAQVTTACCYLNSIGKAERVMMNIYRATTNLQNGPTVHVGHEGTVETTGPLWEHDAIGHGQSLGEPKLPGVRLVVPKMPKLEEVMERAHLVVPKLDPTMLAAAVEPSNDETMNLVLDLMFPNGFKASHLDLINAWKKITLNLMKAVQS